MDIDGTKHSYAGGSIRSSLFGIYGRFDAVKDTSNKTNATETTIQTRIGSYDINGKYDQYNKNFLSEQHNQSSDPLLNKTFLKIEGPLIITHLLNSSRSAININKDHFSSNKDRYDNNAELSFIMGKKLSITQGLQYIVDQRIEDSKQRNLTNGKTFANYRA